MTVRYLALFMASMMMTTGAIAPVQAVHPRHGRPIATDWRHVVSATPEGGFRMGNPKAKVALVEYYSFTCPHCAAFVGEALPTIRDTYVKAGTVSFEMRPAVRDRADYLANLLARCTGPSRFFATAEAIFAAQADWETRAVDWDSSHPADFQGPGAAASLLALAQGSGLDAIGKAHGVAPAALSGCLGDPKGQAAVKASTEDAWATRKIGGTPSFLINGKLLDGVFGWPGLQPKLDEALKG